MITMVATDLYPLLFEPNLHHVIWGGDRLPSIKGLPADPEPVGESWEVSAVPTSTSIIANGPWAGQDLISVISRRPEEILGHEVARQYDNQLPLLVKLIDAKRDLSIQVHPNDEMARRVHGKRGKTEMWYVIDAAPGASLLAGFKREISQYEFRNRIEDNSIVEVLARHEVRPGDVFYIPAGRVHAICGGIFLAEVQQSSDVTYRIYDYNRPGLDGKLRELHTELAEDAIDYKVYSSYLTNYIERVNKPVLLTECPYFTVKIHNVTRAFHRKLFKYDSFIIYLCLEGECTIRPVSDPDTAVSLRRGGVCLIPACDADLYLVPNDATAKILEVFIDNKHFN